ncbi:MAG: hypothetical protein AAFR47_05045 [Pseudomonadota bacterium]
MAIAGAILFSVASLAVMALHVALVAGAPIGDMTMGGGNPGVLPLAARMASAAQAILVGCLAIVVLNAAGLVDAPLISGTRRGIWMAVAVSAISSVLNTITPSRRERLFGMPATFALLAGSLAVALGD